MGKKRIDVAFTAWVCLVLVLLPMNVYAEEEAVYSKSVVDESSYTGQFGKVTPIKGAEVKRKEVRTALFARFTGDCVVVDNSAGTKGNCTPAGVNYTAFLSMSSPTNAHASNDTAHYNYTLCCPGDNISNNNSRDAFSTAVALKLNKTSNSHTGSDTSGYSIEMILSSPHKAEANCSYGGTSNDPCNNSNSYYCFARLSTSVNAHISNCSDTNRNYENICCKVCSPEEQVCNVDKDCCDIPGGTSACVMNFDRPDRRCCPAGKCWDGEYDNCVPNGNYTEDRFCDNGTWTTRTRLVAEALLNLTGSGNYTLFCENYLPALVNRYDYPVDGCYTCKGDNSEPACNYFLENESGSFSDSSRCRERAIIPQPLEGGLVNQICVLRYGANGENVSIGMSLNQPVNSINHSILEMFYLPPVSGYSYDDCDSHIGNNVDVYEDCNDNRYYNDYTNSLIYSTGAVSTSSVLLSFFRSIISFFTGTLTETAQEDALSFLNQSNFTNYKRLFVAKSGSKSVRGFAGTLFKSAISGDSAVGVNYLTMNFSGFGALADICDSIDDFNRHISSIFEKISCNYTSGDYLITSDTTANSYIDQIWPQLTARIRLK